MLEVSISFGVLGTARQAQVRGDRAPSAAGSHEKRPAGERGVEPAKAQKPRPIEDPAEQDVSHQSLSVMQDVLLRALLGCCICGHASACVPFERRSSFFYPLVARDVRPKNTVESRVVSGAKTDVRQNALLKLNACPGAPARLLKGYGALRQEFGRGRRSCLVSRPAGFPCRCRPVFRSVDSAAGSFAIGIT